MALMTWSDRLSVGVKVLDEDHKKLVAMVNELYEAIMQGKGKQKLGEVLTKLIQYTVEHFRREEQLFARTGYANAEKHHAEHRKLTEEVLKVQKTFEADASATISMDVLNFLRHWLIDHIQGEDQKYSAHLNSHGIK